MRNGAVVVFAVLAAAGRASLMSDDSDNQSRPAEETENGALKLIAGWQASCFL